MSPRPICFMVMPFGTKPTSPPPGHSAPAKVNFDRLWQAAIRPAIDALGYDPVRADQDLGALIIHEMIERLAISDLVIADITIPNGNVYYEIGVRHAAQRHGCVMIAADWTLPLFDIEQMRRIVYPLPAENISDEVATQIREKLMGAIPKLATGESPVFELLPGYPDRLDPSRSAVFRDSLRRLSDFQAEINAARSAGPDEGQRRALELRQRFHQAGPVQKAVALELLYALRDCAGWEATLEFIEDLPPEMSSLPIVQEQKALAQSKSGNHLIAIGGLQEMIRLNGETSECRGLLGGRYKELWAAEPPENKVQKSRYLDQAIQEYERGMRADLNDYYPSSNLPRLYRTRGRKGDDDRARTAAAVTLIACDRGRLRQPADEWLKPTLLGAAFDSGDVEKAASLVDEISVDGPAAWKLQTTIDDLRLAVQFQDEAHAREFGEILTRLESLRAAATGSAAAAGTPQ